MWAPFIAMRPPSGVTLVLVLYAFLSTAAKRTASSSSHIKLHKLNSMKTVSPGMAYRWQRCMPAFSGHLLNIKSL